MIERFNFYDVYGYLLPGLVFTVCIWLPFGLVNGKLPQAELLSTVLLLAFSYVVGHLLQSVCTSAVASLFSDKGGRLRRPSDILLDKSEIHRSTRQNLFKKVKEDFGIDLDAAPDGTKEASSAREQAFFMARPVLLKQKLLVYAEQFQGLYAMMRGLCVTAFLAAAYFAAWGLAVKPNQCARWVATISDWSCALVIVTVGFVRISKIYNASAQTHDRIILRAVVIAAIASGYLLGSSYIPTVGASKILLCLALVSTIASQRFYLGYRYFAFEFARSVWRDYASLGDGALLPIDTEG